MPNYSALDPFSSRFDSADSIGAIEPESDCDCDCPECIFESIGQTLVEDYWINTGENLFDSIAGEAIGVVDTIGAKARARRRRPSQSRAAKAKRREKLRQAKERAKKAGKKINKAAQGIKKVANHPATNVALAAVGSVAPLGTAIAGVAAVGLRVAQGVVWVGEKIAALGKKLCPAFICSPEARARRKSRRSKRKLKRAGRAARRGDTAKAAKLRRRSSQLSSRASELRAKAAKDKASKGKRGPSEPKAVARFSKRGPVSRVMREQKRAALVESREAKKVVSPNEIKARLAVQQGINKAARELAAMQLKAASGDREAAAGVVATQTLLDPKMRRAKLYAEAVAKGFSRPEARKRAEESAKFSDAVFSKIQKKAIALTGGPVKMPVNLAKVRKAVEQGARKLASEVDKAAESRGRLKGVFVPLQGKAINANSTGALQSNSGRSGYLVLPTGKIVPGKWGL